MTQFMSDQLIIRELAGMIAAGLVTLVIGTIGIYAIITMNILKN